MIYFGTSRVIDSVWTCGAQGYRKPPLEPRSCRMGGLGSIRARPEGGEVAVGMAVTGAGYQWD